MKTFAETAYVDGVEWSYFVSDGKATVGSGTPSSTAVSETTTGAVTIPSALGGCRVTGIGDYAFRDCSRLTRVTIPNGVTNIGCYAFADCSGLAGVAIGNDVTSIGENAFIGCSKLASVTLPGNVKDIGEGAFSHCSGLANVAIPESVTNIGAYAFYDCSKLADVTLPNGVTHIWNGTFSGCTGLKKLTLLGTVENTGDFSPFSDCTGLESVVIGGKVARIGNSMFSDCSKLKSVAIGSRVKTIGTAAFLRCASLKNVKLPDSVTDIGEGAFHGCNGLASVAIPNGVTNIGNFAFSECVGLTSVTLGSSVKSIGECAFDGCSGLKNVTLPKSVKNIGDYAFSGCNGLTSVTIPDGVTTLGDLAFYACQGLKSVTIANGVAKIGYHEFWACRNLTSVTIGRNVKSIGDRAFEECLRLETLIVPSGVTKVGDYAFKDSGLKTLYVPAGWKGTAKLKYAGLPAGCKVVYGLPSWTVAFDANGGTCATKSKKVVKGDAVGTLPKATRTGYTLAGWYTAKSGGSKISTSTKITANRTFYARWTPTTYKIAFNANGGTGTMAAQSVKYGATAKLRAITFKRTGYAFQGWAKTAAGAVAYQNAASVKNLRSDGKTVTLYAKWKATTYKVAFNANGGTGTMAAQTLTYGKAAKLSKNAFKRSGWTFLGWSKTKTGAVAYKNAQAVKNLRADGKTTTLYAVWAKNSYKIAFKANGGTGSMAVQSMKYGTAANLRKNAFKRTGYTFGGWAKTATGSVAYKNAQAVKNLRTDGGTTTLYAKWTATTYKVAFNANGGTGTMATQSVKYDATAKLSANAFQRDGFTFGGWAKSAGGAVAYANQASVKNLRADAGTTTLYAKWNETTYKVAFDANGGTGTMGEQSLKYATAMALSANAFSRDGFTFQGWSRTATGNVAYTDRQSVKGLVSDGGTVTLYAVWEPDPAAETTSTPVAVPYSWLDGKAAGILAANGGDYEATAKAKAANGHNTVWECYVAGLDPEKAEQEFTAELSFEDGKPVVSSAPEGVEGRTYTVEAKKDLTAEDEDWTDVTDNPAPESDGYRFFRVGVSLPE